MVDVHDFIQQTANKFETVQNPGESDEDFRMRLSKIILTRKGDAYLAFEILNAKPREMFTPEEIKKADFFNQVYQNLEEMKFAFKKDTYKSMDWEYYDSALVNFGFQKQLSYDFHNPGRETDEQYSIWFRKKGAMLLFAESSHDKLLVADSVLFCEVNHTRDLSVKGQVSLDRLLKTNPGTPITEDGKIVARTMKINAKQGLGDKIDYLDALNMNIPWKYYGKSLLYLLDSSETFHKRDRHFSEYTNEKLDKMPLELRLMIGDPRAK